MAVVRYRIEHRTQYAYSEPVAICQNQLRMQPSNRHGLTVHDTTITIAPQPDSITEHLDCYDNRVFSFAIEHLHNELTVKALSDVSITPPPSPKELAKLPWQVVAEHVRKQPWSDGHSVQEFCFDSPRVRREDAFAQYAAVSFTESADVITAALDLTQRIHADFRYDTSATDVNTPTLDAFNLRAGVCQDFAHIQIACLRSLGLPARYVSGYLRTLPTPGKPRAVGADESHAWLSIYAGPQVGWLDCDPTNAKLCDADHIPICIGRDYSDVSPMRGVILGGGRTTLKVRVDVQPLESP